MTAIPPQRPVELSGYLPYPHSLSPLPATLRHGLFVVSAFALVSLVSTTILFFFLLYRLFISPSATATSQPVLLIFNLILAELQQAVAFTLNLQWAINDGILAPSTTCSAQGWFVSMGDLSSGLFSLAIAAQTYLLILHRWQPTPRVFTLAVLGIWSFGLAVSVAGPAAHWNDPTERFFVRASAWCWVNPKFAAERLYLHYLWIFICEFGSLAIYLFLFINLHRRPKSLATTALSRLARTMLLYPVAYTLCTLPLAAGRMATSAGNTPGLGFFVFAGACMASCGWVDCLLYTCTRRMVVVVPGPEKQERARQLRYGTITTIVNIRRPPGDPQSEFSLSMENIVRLEQVVEVTVEDAAGGGCERGGGGDGVLLPWEGADEGDGGR